jgi:ribosomal protein L9
MKIILLEDVKGKGLKDQVIETADGYGNFLVKQKKAVIASAENLNILNRKLDKAKADHEKRVQEANRLKCELETVSIKFSGKVTPRGTLDRKITTRDVASKINSTFNTDVDKHKIELPTEIDAPGDYTVKVKLYNSISAKIRVIVEAV